MGSAGAGAGAGAGAASAGRPVPRAAVKTFSICDRVPPEVDKYSTRRFSAQATSGVVPEAVAGGKEKPEVIAGGVIVEVGGPEVAVTGIAMGE